MISSSPLSTFKTVLLSVLLLLCGQAVRAQEVYADQLVSNSGDLYNAARITDTSRTNYAHASSLLGLLSTTYARMRFPENRYAGDVVNVVVQSTGTLLGASLLNNVTIKLYDSLGNQVATAAGSSLLQLSLLVPGSNIYAIKFFTNPGDNYTFREARVEFSNLVSLSLLNEFRVYNVHVQVPCPPVYADNVYASGATGLIPGFVNNASNAADANPNNFATLNIPINILGATAYLDLEFPIRGNAGDYVGFTIGQASTILSLSLLGYLDVKVYDDNNVQRDIKNNFTLADLKLLSGTTDRYTIGFLTQPGSYRISRLRITMSATVGVLQNLNVYNAFRYQVSRPQVTVAVSGPTSFCQGGSVTLSATDSLGQSNFQWSTGATTPAITVTTSGIYSVSVIDSSSCSRKSMQIAVNVYARPQPFITGDSVLCTGAIAGNLHTAVTYASYQWSTAATAASIAVSNPGNYWVSVIDSNGCTGIDTITVLRSNLSVVPVITAATCSNGTNGAISLGVSGGSGNYAYRWYDGTTTNVVSNLKPGIYTAEIKDNTYGCTHNRAFTVTANTLSIKAAIVHASGCGKSDGKIYASVVGGSGSYSYSWSNGANIANPDSLAAGIYRLNVTDLVSGCTAADTILVSNAQTNLLITPAVTATSGCNSATGSINITVTGGSGNYSYIWSNGATTQNLGTLAAGNYYLVVKDNIQQCRNTAAINVPVTGLLDVNGAITASGCNAKTGAISLAVTNGSGNYSYGWSTGAATAAVGNLQSGTYTVTVTDVTKGCTQQKVFVVGESNGPLATLAATQPSCSTNAGGSIQLSPSLSGAYSYRWSDGSVTKDIFNLKPGSYTVAITYSTNGCTSLYQSTLTARRQIRLAAAPKPSSSCSLSPNGAITLQLLSGTAPYSFSWNNSAITQNLVNIAPGTYSVSVQDANSCGITLAVPVKTDSANLLSITTLSKVKASCNTSSTGGINIQAAGGTAPYTYHWSNNASTQNLSNVLPGIYTVTVTDALGCTRQATDTVGIDSATYHLAVSLDSVRNAGCGGSSSGAVFISVSGGTSPYTYSWNNTATTQNLSNVLAGSYTVTVTDNHNCTAQAAATVGVSSNAVVIALDSVKRPSCTVSLDGTAYISIAGGAAPYSYSWSNGATTKNLVNVNPGTYTLTATDANGCPKQFTVAVPYDTTNTLKVVVDSVKGASCAAGNSAAIYITASRGTLPYTYHWSNNATTANLINVTPGAYSVQVTDGKGCVVAATAQPGVDTAQSLKVFIDSAKGAGCNGSNSGRLYVHVTGGKLPYTYFWSNGATSQNLLNAAPGAYTLTVHDASGCTVQQAGASIGVDTAQSVHITIDSTRAAGCAGSGSGSVYISATGGQAPYTYYWSNNSTFKNLLNVQAASYTVTVTDNNGCSSQKTATVPVAAGNFLSISLDSFRKTTCNVSLDGALYPSVSGGLPPYTYSWSNGATTRNLLNVASGTYTLTATDANGCPGQYTTAVVIDTASSLKATVDSAVSAGCASGTTAAIYVTATGGTAPYSYHWSTGATSANLLNVLPGNYTVQITDARGCVVTKTAQPGVDTVNKGLKIIADTVKGAACSGNASGSIYIHVTGGKLPYTYTWSNGATTQNIVNLVPAPYTVTVSDAGGCNRQKVITLGIDTPSLMTVTLDSIRAAGCSGNASGAVYVHVTGGKAPLSYSWTNSTSFQNLLNVSNGNYTLTVTDNRLCQATFAATVPVSVNTISITLDSTRRATCNTGSDGKAYVSISGGKAPYTYSWSNGASVKNLVNANPGTHTLTVTDANGCTGQKTVTILMDTANTLVATVDSVRGAGCITGSNASIYLGVSGGTLPYSYSWSNGATTQNLVNVYPGLYTVQVTDAHGCSISRQAQPGVDINKAIHIVFDSTKGAGCIASPSGRVYVHVTGGTLPLNYLWSNSAVSQNLNNVAPGNYTLTVTDAGNCSDVKTVAVGVDTALAIHPHIDSTVGAGCIVSPYGKVYLSATGGKLPYTFAWSNGATTQHITGVKPGAYSVQLTDANNCGVQIAAVVPVDSTKRVKVSSSIVTGTACPSVSTGSVVLGLSGGVNPLGFVWSNGATTQNLTNLAMGNYSLTITDYAGCNTYYQADLGLDTPHILGLQVVGVVGARCIGSQSGAVIVGVLGGQAPYNYSWSNGAITQNLAYAFAGAYTLNVTDAHGCAAQANAVIGYDTTNPVRTVVDSITAAGCKDTNSGVIYISTQGGTIPYTHYWTNGAITEDLFGVPPGAYTVTATDNAGCKSLMTATVKQALPVVFTSSTEPIKCYGDRTGGITVAASGGSGLYQYKWSTGDITNKLQNLYAGSYVVTVEDALTGCLRKDTFNLTQPDSLAFTFTITKDTCYGDPSGAVAVQVAGGVPPYVYQWSTGGNYTLIDRLRKGLYTLKLSDDNGCQQARTVDVPVTDCDFDLNIHNAVTPNGDGVNDYWVIEGIEYYPHCQVQVFDKLGDKVFETGGYHNNWDGRGKNGELPSGTYYYVIKLNEGNRATGKEAYTGYLMIQR